jgi:hypothetical protein
MGWRAISQNREKIQKTCGCESDFLGWSEAGGGANQLGWNLGLVAAPVEIREQTPLMTMEPVMNGDPGTIYPAQFPAMSTANI